MTEPRGVMLKIKGADKPCYAARIINNKYVSCGDMFNLYAGEMGKPHNLICLYQKGHWVDIGVLDGVYRINGKTLPRYLGTILEMYYAS